MPEPKKVKLIRPDIAAFILGIEVKDIEDMNKVESAYKRMVRTVHPDINSGPEAARLLHLATWSRDSIKTLLKIREKERQQTGTVRVVVKTADYGGFRASWNSSTSGW